MDRNKIIFFGAGDHAEYLWQQMQKMPFLNNQCIAFTDNNPNLWGKKFKDLEVLAPSELSDKSADLFVITSIYEKAIKRQLTDEIGISENKIYTFDEYKRKCYTQWQYQKRYAGKKSFSAGKDCFELNRVVIYTAIMGGYDELHDPLFTDDNLTYVCFTNNENIKSDIWHVEYIHDDKLDHMHLAKKVKLFPHLYFKDFNTSIWVDGKLEIQADLRSYVCEYERDKEMLCFPHYERECIYEEAGTCLFYGKGNKEELIRQISEYYRGGYPINNGLYEMACIVRRHNDDLVQKVMTDWYQEIERYSYRDQVSFPVACYRNHFLPDICDMDIYHNKWLKVYAHVL